MANINRDYVVIVDLKTAKVQVPQVMEFFNTDEKISNIFIKLNSSETQVSSDEVATDYTVKLELIKPKTYSYEPIDATFISEEENIKTYEVDLPSNYIDEIGKYNCQVVVSAIVNDSTEKFTSEAFQYVVKADITTKLNGTIEADPDYSILKQLIAEVSLLKKGLELDEIQLKTDSKLTTVQKDIVGAINQNTLDIKEILNNESAAVVVGTVDDITENTVLLIDISEEG